MYLLWGIISIIIGVFFLRLTIKFWIKHGIANGNSFQGLVGSLCAIVLGIVFIVKFFSN